VRLAAHSAQHGRRCPPKGLKLDGVDQTSALRGEDSSYKPKRCWQWNRYDPQIEYNAAIRDGDWKLVRPFVPEAFEVPDIKWLDVSMYEPEHFIENGIITDPAPEVILPPAPPVELYNLNDDPLEQNNLALQRPQRVQHMERDLHTWFEDVCNDLKKTSRD
jgi:arylsulfatase A-like enzyme